MITSDAIDQIAVAFVAAQAELEAVTKAATAAIRTKSGASYDYQFASFPDVQRAVLPVFAKHGLAVIQGTADEDDSGFVIETTVLHSSGQWFQTRVRVPMRDATAQGAGSGFAYGRRIGMVGMAGLITNDIDDDGAKATEETSGNPKARKAEPADKEPSGTIPNECTKCGGPVFDNRVGKKNPKAPDWRCKDKECVDERGYVTGGWREKDGINPAKAAVPGHPDDAPPPDDDDLPY